MDTQWRLVDYSDEADGRLLVELLDAYARDPMGGGEPLSNHCRRTLAGVLAATSNAFSLVVERQGQAVALANCFTALSTFAAQPLVNVHDVYVAPDARGGGAVNALFSGIESHARALGACKITLEVLEGNARAKAAYARLGFQGYELGETLGSAEFWERSLS